MAQLMQVTVAHPEGLKLHRLIELLQTRYDVTIGQGVAVDGIPTNTIVVTNKRTFDQKNGASSDQR